MANRFLNINIRHSKGQSVLETAVALVIIFIFLGAVVNIWLWGNRQIVNRQKWYCAPDLRILAGQSRDLYIMPIWPNGGIAPRYDAQVKHSLNEKDVILGGK